MSCRRARMGLFRAADGELPIEERLALDAHVEACPRCGPLARAMQRLDEGFVRLPEPPIERLDLDATVRAVRARFDRSAGPPKLAGAPQARWWIVAAAAAAVLVAWIVLRSSDSATTLPVIAEPAPRSVDPTAPTAAHGLRDGARRASAELAPGELDSSSHLALQDQDGAQRIESSERAGDADGLRPVDDCDSATEPPEPLGPGGLELASTLPSGSEAEPRRADRDSTAVPHPAHVPPTPEELARVEAARSDLGAALIEALRTSHALARSDLELSFSRATAPLERAGWPVLRLAVVLAHDDDVESARAALRYVGLFGGRNELAVIQRALATEELALVAELALADLGAPALELLAERMQDLDLAPRLIARLTDRPAEEAVELCEALARHLARSGARSGLEPRARAARGATHQGLVRRVSTALARHGAPAVGALLRLANDGALPGDEALALLRMVPGASNALADQLRGGPRALDPRTNAALVVASIEVLRPVNGARWLEERARTERASRDLALRGLASYADGEALEALLRLALAGPVGIERVRELITQAIDARPEAASELAGRLHAARERASAQELFDLLAARPRPACVPGWIALAGSDLLPRSDRRSAVQAASELGLSDAAPLLAGLFVRLPESERDLRAMTLMALHRLGGRAGVEALFPRAPTKALERLMELLADPAAHERPTTTSFRVARELDSFETASTP